jgi:hypothetical protein
MLRCYLQACSFDGSKVFTIYQPFLIHITRHHSLEVNIFSSSFVLSFIIKIKLKIKIKLTIVVINNNNFKIKKMFL